jgi:ribosomal protein S27E
VSPLGLPSPLTRFFQEFHCRGCGNNEAYRSRPRGFVEKGLLPLMMLRPVRCDRCYHRSYIFRTVPVLERVGSGDKSSPKRPQSTSGTGTRVA